MDTKKIKSIIHDCNNQLQVLQSLLYLNRQELGIHYKRISGIISTISNKNFCIEYYGITKEKYHFKSVSIDQFRKEITYLVNKFDEVFFPITSDTELSALNKNVYLNHRLFDCIVGSIFESFSKINTSHLVFEFKVANDGLKLVFKGQLLKGDIPSDEDLKIIQDLCHKCNYKLKINYSERKEFSILIFAPYIN